MTSSVETTKSEIIRFLLGVTPGVLCVTGRWGVGKTFLWRTLLDDLRNSKRLSLTRYSYVSLFGLNSLDDVKISLFENMDWLDSDPVNYASYGKTGVKALTAHAMKLSEMAGALPYIGQFFSRARPLYFSLIRNQIICIDDLERRSKNLDIKDILGLVSYLNEHRGCKIALILNSEMLEENKIAFESLFEKVVETKVVLSPSPTESANIALQCDDNVSIALRTHSENLGIRNIRIIKQLERMARRINELLIGFDQSVRDQALHSITLFGWAKLDHENAPNLDFLKISSIERCLSRNSAKTQISKAEANWESLLNKYKFTFPDDFDLSLMNYVETSLLDAEDIQLKATTLQEQQRIGILHNALDAAWRPFHDSFEDNQDQVVHEIIEGMTKSYEITSLSNLNAAILLLKKLGRLVEASNLISFYSENRNDPNYWKIDNDLFAPRQLDPEISVIIEKLKSAEPMNFDLSEALICAGKTFDTNIISKLATIPVDDYFKLISSTRGENKELIVQSALEFRRIANASDDMKKVVLLMEEALQMVGRKSALNAMRVSKYGISV